MANGNDDMEKLLRDLGKQGKVDYPPELKTATKAEYVTMIRKGKKPGCPLFGGAVLLILLAISQLFWARAKKPSGSNQLKTGNDFIEKARGAGANIGKQDRKGFVEITTRTGSTHIQGGKQPLDPRTRKFYKAMFRLLGLLAVIFFIMRSLL